MKTVIILSLLLYLASPVCAELTKEDIRTIIKEENAASEKRLKEYIDLKIDAVDKGLNARIDGVEKSLNARIDGVEKSLNTRIDALEKSVDDRFDAVDKKLDWVWYMIIALIGLITAAIAIPQIIIAVKEKGRKEMQTEIDQLHEKIESMSQSINELMHQ